MRLLLPIVGIVALLVKGYAIQIRFSPNHVSGTETRFGPSVYDLHVNDRGCEGAPGTTGTPSVEGSRSPRFGELQAASHNRTCDYRGQAKFTRVAVFDTNIFTADAWVLTVSRWSVALIRSCFLTRIR